MQPDGETIVLDAAVGASLPRGHERVKGFTMQKKLTLLVFALMMGGLAAQQPNTPFAGLNVDGPAFPPVSAPVTMPVFTDSDIMLNIHGFPGSNPVVVLFATSFAAGGSISFDAVSSLNQYGFQLDIPDQGAAGYSDQEYVNGYVQPGSLSYTDNVGDLQLIINLPACVTVNNQPICITQPNWEVTAQALVVDPTNAPFNIRSTGAGTGQFSNGYQEFSLSGDQFATFTFLGGLTVPFYGNVYSQARVSSNGFVAFTNNTGGLAGFPNPTPNGIASGPPQIMTFYNDLEPQITAFNPRVYAQQFVEVGPGGGLVRKVKFVHERLAEFSNTTGPHGGEAVITENGDIAVLVAGYNSTPSINTGVGITRGSGGPAVVGFGRDLSMDVALGPTTVPAGQHAFELFDHGNTTPSNALDLVSLGLFSNNGVGPGIAFLLNPTTSNTSPATTSYIIQ